MTDSKLEISPGQSWLMERMQCLGYHTDPDGVCYGLAYMAVQAILANDLDTFNRRLSLIAKIPTDQFENTINEAKQKSLVIIQNAKKQAKKAFLSLTKLEREQIEKQPILVEKLNELNKIIEKLERDNQLDENKLNELNERREQLILSFLQQKYINFHLKKADPIVIGNTQYKMNEILDIIPFFEGISIYFAPGRYPEIFEGGMGPKIQHGIATSPTVISNKLQEKQGISRIDFFCGAYSAEDLKIYLDTLQSAINDKHPPVSNPIAFNLNSVGHAITIGYDPNKKLLFIDSNRLPTQYLESTEEMATHILSAFSKNGVATFSSEIFASKEAENEIQEVINHWKEHPEWKRIHTITDEKKQLADSNGHSWLHVAAARGFINELTLLMEMGGNSPSNGYGKEGEVALRQAGRAGQFETVNFLLEAGVDSNSCFTEIILARNADVVKAFIDHGADVNQIHKESGVTALYRACVQGDLNVVRLLLEAQADPNQPSPGSHYSALYFACSQGNLELVKLLLEFNADPNVLTKNGNGPLYIAAKNNFPEIVEVLLQTKKVNPLHICIDHKDTLLQFASAYNKTDEMNELIKENEGNNSIVASTPLEIATVMGNQKISNLLTREILGLNLSDQQLQQLNSTVAGKIFKNLLTDVLSTTLKNPKPLERTQQIQAWGLLLHNLFNKDNANIQIKDIIHNWQKTVNHNGHKNIDIVDPGNDLLSFFTKSKVNLFLSNTIKDYGNARPDTVISDHLSIKQGGFM
ncbi:ankyrin repeat domain-containing protein [Legionella resiliens]|uniref:Ankyrin repeat domain-containing protein n=1 Tax=Legionella resiliens TaxID=2905958 RepID=A0ABS8X0Z2_9GAMM|nr:MULTISPECIES: ankyrin repeat domain-containing protein [unclassified Legionella]MCE0722480.1 ankyrin repeat domain-containing protein [Legionella sp. 9fVS26]MCE3531634.1 ankyrin repeat domain-containing protein [Legionella sp. 8cVS16]